MRRYETVIISDPDLSEEARTALFEKFKEIISQRGGEVIVLDEWGTQRLAYTIKKKPRGFYSRVDYCGTGKSVDELERFCRIDDRVMKYLTVMLEEDTTPERIREEIARKAEAKNKPPVAEADADESDIEPETAASESVEAEGHDEKPEEVVAQTTEQPHEEE